MVKTLTALFNQFLATGKGPHVSCPLLYDIRVHQYDYQNQKLLDFLMFMLHCRVMGQGQVLGNICWVRTH